MTILGSAQCLFLALYLGLAQDLGLGRAQGVILDARVQTWIDQMQDKAVFIILLLLHDPLHCTFLYDLLCPAATDPFTVPTLLPHIETFVGVFLLYIPMELSNKVVWYG